MAVTVRDRIRNEQIHGEVFDMSPAPDYRHSIVCGNLHAIIREGLKKSLCLVFMENIDYKYDSDSEDYLEPDIIICCDRKKIKGGSYYGCPKFIAEVISPSTVKRDRGIKKDIYEKSGVEEYWIISPVEQAIEIYYLKDGRYVLEDSYVLDAEEESEHYNCKQVVRLRSFPVEMTLEEIFDMK